ncbi:MAG: D-aminoacylase [Actinobacteria bacterium]|nr:D-aminoacylase [Actinomycetota bacterium]
MHDLLLQGGSVHDGLGAPARTADVAVRGDRVVAVGRDLGPARRSIDVTGHCVTPGFVDAHAHSDGVAFMSEPQPFKLLQGVTTEVVGNCGFSLAPLNDVAAAHAREAWGDLFPGFEPEPMSFANYIDKVTAAGPTNNIAPLVGHGTLRLCANGTRRELADGALDAMRDLANEAMAAGAAGLSSGLIYVPGTYADTDELVAVAAVAGRWGRPYTTHMRNEANHVVDSISEAVEIGRRAGCRVQISHCKVSGTANWGGADQMLAAIHRGRLDGVDVRGDQYPYMAGSTFLAALLPPDALEGGFDRIRAAAADPASLAALRDEFQPSTLWEPASPERTTIIGHLDGSLVGRTLADVAQERGQHAFVVLCQLVTDDPSAMIVVHLMDDTDVERLMADPLLGVGSDNGPPLGVQHPRTWGTFPWLLGEFVRRRGVLGIEQAVRKMTSATAAQFGLLHRGTLQPGAIADIAVFDPDTVDHAGTYAAPNASPTGIPWVVLGGEVVVDDGEFSGARSGRVLRPGLI